MCPLLNMCHHLTRFSALNALDLNQVFYCIPLKISSTNKISKINRIFFSFILYVELQHLFSSITIKSISKVDFSSMIFLKPFHVYKILSCIWSSPVEMSYVHSDLSTISRSSTIQKWEQAFIVLVPISIASILLLLFYFYYFGHRWGLSQD